MGRDNSVIYEINKDKTLLSIHLYPSLFQLIQILTVAFSTHTDDMKSCQQCLNLILAYSNCFFYSQLSIVSLVVGNIF